MIHTAKQLKDKVKNMSGGNSEVLSYNLETLSCEKGADDFGKRTCEYQNEEF